MHYNIASRVAQSNSVYVSVLKISTVHADCASKLLRQKLFFARAAIVNVGKNIKFATIMNRNRDSAHHAVPKRRQFPTFSPELEFLNGAEKEKNNGKGDGISVVTKLESRS